MHQSMNMTHVPCQNSVQPSVVYQQSKPIHVLEKNKWKMKEMMNQRCTTLDQKENEEYQKVSIGGKTMFNIDKTETRRNME